MKAIFIRHAHRTKIPMGEFGNSLPITNEGCKAARRLGKHLKDLPITTLVSSPLLRCLQTSEALRKGLQKKIPIVRSKWLGDPGPFVVDPTKAAQNFKQKDAKEVYGQLFEGKLLPGMRPLQEGVELLLASIDSRGLVLMVTHDFLLAALNVFFLGENRWPDFLEMIFISDEVDPQNALSPLQG